MHRHLHKHSPFRIFFFSTVATLAALVGVSVISGADALAVTLILIAVEVSFSFDNAIINAHILAKLSPFWQQIFLTVGMIIAVLGMRVVFPILLVSITAHLSWGNVIDLALNHPHEYAEKLEHAHPTIAAFGGAFLAMLTLQFFLDDNRGTLWFKRLERQLQRLASFWAPAAITAILISLLAILPFNPHRRETFTAGLLGVLVFMVIHKGTELLGKTHTQKDKAGGLTGMAALWTFVYLELLDASFSFDGVIGAFAITSKVVLIAIGLGVGALWVRSLTVFMVRRGTLKEYIYLEHGAHYTVGVLACVLFLSLFWHVPDILAGISGLGFIVASIVASRQALNHAGKAS